MQYMSLKVDHVWSDQAATCSCLVTGHLLTLLVLNYLVIEVIKEPQHAMLILRISIIDVLQKLDLIKALVKVVFVVLHTSICHVKHVVLSSTHEHL